MASSKYKYDIKIGHYVLLTEGEQTQVATDGTESQEQQTQDQQQIQTHVTNLDGPDVLKMRQEKENVLKNMQDTVKRKTDNLIQCQQAVANLQNNQEASQDEINNAQKTLVQAMKEVSDAKFDIVKKGNEYDNKIYQLQLSLIESMKAARNSLPEKYQSLNESNVQNAKIYINKIIENDYQERIKGMVDFKKAFANSNLLYGKDKEGFFAVCLDQEDLNKLTNTLLEVGYNKDDIYSVVLSQMFDRSDLVKA